MTNLQAIEIADSSRGDSFDAVGATGPRDWFDEEFDKLETRFDVLTVVLGSVRESEMKMHFENVTRGLAVVHDSLRGLNQRIVETRGEPWTRADSPLMSYLSWTYVWCADLTSDQLELSLYRGSPTFESRRCEINESTLRYVAESLEPLYRQLEMRWERRWLGRAATPVRTAFDALHAKVALLSQSLHPAELPPRPDLRTRNVASSVRGPRV